jgi:hypothetical protein
MGPMRGWHSPPCWGSPPMMFRSERAPGQNLSSRPIRSPAPAPPRTPTPIRTRRRCPVTPRQAFLLETTSKGVSAGVKAIADACGLILATEFFRGNARGQGQSANRPCQPRDALCHEGPLSWSIRAHGRPQTGDTVPPKRWAGTNDQEPVSFYYSPVCGSPTRSSRTCSTAADKASHETAETNDATLVSPIVLFGGSRVAGTT